MNHSIPPEELPIVVEALRAYVRTQKQQFAERRWAFFHTDQQRCLMVVDSIFDHIEALATRLEKKHNLQTTIMKKWDTLPNLKNCLVCGEEHGQSGLPCPKMNPHS